MTHYLVNKSSLQGEIKIPPSKSHSLRAILFAALAKGKSYIYDFLPSPDAKAMIDACSLLGAQITAKDNNLEIIGLGSMPKGAENVIDAGNSGIVLRYITAIASLGKEYVVLTGDHSIRHRRPMKPLLEGLTGLGALATSTRGDGFAPILVRGPLSSGKTVLNGEDSQPISALLIATSLLEGKSQILVKNPGEKPWIDMTLHWLEKMGVNVTHKNYELYDVPGHAIFESFQYRVPGDLSTFAFPIVAALVTRSELTLQNVDMSDCQGDKKIIEVLQNMGAKFEINPLKKTLKVLKDQSLRGIEVDINDFVDAITILTVAACFAEGETLIKNAFIARTKESDRISAIATELRKMGASIIETEDGLRIKGTALRGGRLYSHQDHRMVMSLAVAGLGAEGETRIDSIECVSKTFPTFFQDFKKIGCNIDIMQ